MSEDAPQVVLVRTTTSPAVNAPDYVPPLKVLLCREEVDIKNNARTDKLMKNGAGRARMFGRVKPAELVSYLGKDVEVPRTLLRCESGM